MDGSIRIETELDTKSFDAQIAKLEADLQTMVKTLETDAQVDIKVRMSESERLKLENDIEKTKNRIVSLQQQKEKFENEGNDFKNVHEGFKGLTRSAKNLVMGIIGVRGAYSLIRRAASTYLQSDEKLTKQLEANWVALGQIIAPVVEMLVGFIRKAVTAVLYFMSVLTGVNYIEKANNAIIKQNNEAIKKNTKNTKANTKAKKENQKVLAGFDEMNVLSENKSDNTDVGNIDTGTTATTPMPLFDVKELGNAKKAIERIAEALKPVFNIIEKIVKWAIKNPGLVVAILGGIALIKFLSKILGIAGIGGSGLLGIHSILLAIAAIGVITIAINISKIQEAIDDSKKLNNNLQETRKLNTESTKAETEAIEKQIPAMKKNSKQVKETTKSLIDNIKQQKNYSNVAMTAADNTSWLNRKIDEITGTYATEKEQIRSATESEYLNLMALKKMYDQGKLNDEQTKEYAEALKDFKNRLEYSTSESRAFLDAWISSEGGIKKVETILEDTDEALDQIGIGTGFVASGLATLSGTKVNIEVKNPFDDLAKKINNIKDKLKSVGSKEWKVKVQLDVATSVSKTGNDVANMISNLFASGKIKMAQGGIVNNPGRGVPIANNIIAGEAGPEAVIPLDDKTMASLGKMIAQNMVINLTTVNQMNGRVISRELNKINANSDFAYNR